MAITAATRGEDHRVHRAPSTTFVGCIGKEDVGLFGLAGEKERNGEQQSRRRLPWTAWRERSQPAFGIGSHPIDAPATEHGTEQGEREHVGGAFDHVSAAPSHRSASAGRPRKANTHAANSATCGFSGAASWSSNQSSQLSTVAACPA